MRHTIILLAICILPSVLFAQHTERMGMQLRSFIGRSHPADAEVDLLLRGNSDAVANAVRANGGRVKWSIEDRVGATLPIAAVRAFCTDERVQGVEFTLSRGVTMNDSMRVKVRADQVHAGQAPLLQAYQGEGVLVGMIDAGLELLHPDFRDSDGNTRVLRYWDQTLAFDPLLTPMPYGYGQAFDSTQINNGDCPSVDQPNLYGHGSTVTGTAAGNGLAVGKLHGVAPLSDLLIVSSDFSRPNWKASVADAVKYIFDEAALLGRPVVINASLGDYFGSHDGLDAAALFIDDMLDAEPGRAMVCAAGNSGALVNYHLAFESAQDTGFTWFTLAQNSVLGVPAIYFELWADTADMAQVQFAMGADRMGAGRNRYRGHTPYHSINDVLSQLVTDTLWSLSGNRLGVVQYFAELRGGQYRMDVAVPQPDSAGFWYRFQSTGTGRFDVWSTPVFNTSTILGDIIIPNWITVFHDSAHYRYPDTFMRMVDSWACSDKVLTVANFINEVSYVNVNGAMVNLSGTEGALAGGSSNGPTRDGRLKPDVAATGDITLSAAPLDLLQFLIANDPDKVAEGGFHIRGGGTSIASPVVTGAAALIFERCPTANWADVKAAINSSARADAFTDTLPNVYFGNGKLDVFDAIQAAGPHFLFAVDTTICAGDSVTVPVPNDLVTWQWSNGTSDTEIIQNTAGELSIIGTNAAGCFGHSDTLHFTVVPLPTQPLITQVGNILESSAATTYQWVLNGSQIPGADQMMYEITTTGQYAVMITDANGCAATSDTLFVIFTGIAENTRGSTPSVHPNPTRDLLTITLPASAGPCMIELYDAVGRKLFHSTSSQDRVIVDLADRASGTYTLRVTGDGISWSEVVVVQ